MSSNKYRYAAVFITRTSNSVYDLFCIERMDTETGELYELFRNITPESLRACLDMTESLPSWELRWKRWVNWERSGSRFWDTETLDFIDNGYPAEDKELNIEFAIRIPEYLVSLMVDL